MNSAWSPDVVAEHLRNRFRGVLPAEVIDEVLRSVLVERRYPVDGPIAAGVIAAAKTRLERLVRARQWRDPGR